MSPILPPVSCALYSKSGVWPLSCGIPVLSNETRWVNNELHSERRCLLSQGQRFHHQILFWTSRVITEHQICDLSTQYYFWSIASLFLSSILKDKKLQPIPKWLADFESTTKNSCVK